MPYNTRRKSLSLPSLGIHVPGRHPARSLAAAAATPNRSAPEHTPNRIAITSTTVTSHPSNPSKRQKRSHGTETRHRGLSRNRPDDQHMLEQTPPPSPTAGNMVGTGDAGSFTTPSPIDLEGINDGIVEAAMIQLQATANRPHHVKELATVLSQRLTIVQHSANPCAIISSRLAAYLKRGCWSTLAPCPLAKELETVHPRRTYYYLTTCPRQPVPDTITSLVLQRSVISPSISSVASGSDDCDDDVDLRRRELSPSPEVDLSSPEFDEGDDDFGMPTTPVGSLTHSLRYARSHRSASPPLEKDEREFTQTADGLQKRKLARELSSIGTGEQATANAYDTARDDTMFDEKQSVAVNGGIAPIHFITSPAIRATLPSGTKKETDGDSWLKLGTLLEWDHSPESIELDELDCLLDSC